jgi:hypothetical protein
VLSEQIKKPVDCLGRAGERAVDAFRRDEERATKVSGDEEIAELLAQSCWLRERDEAIKGGDGEHAGSMVNR